MQYKVKTRVRNARGITRAAEHQIISETGMRIMLVLCPTDHPAKTPEQLLAFVAAALRMDYSCYANPSRARNLVDLRFIGSYLLRMNFPSITLMQISVLFGGQDHSTVINGLTRTQRLLSSGDLRFCAKYQTALNSVNQWLRKEVLESVSAISA